MPKSRETSRKVSLLPFSFPKPIGRNSTAEEQAWCLVMLNSPRSSYVVATSVFADGGFTGGLFTGGIDPTVLMPQE